MENINEEDDLKPLRIIGTPVMENGRFVLHEYAILNRECGWLCPRCGTEVRICPTSAGRQIHSCSYCGTTFQIEVDAEAVTYLHKKKEEILPHPLPEERRENEKPAGEAKSPIPAGRVISPPPGGKAISSPVAQKETVSVSVGMLQWGSFINKHKHVLNEGSTVIGRVDVANPSDIQFKDPLMSRRSVRIDTQKDENGNRTFVLTVMKALNPVLVNDKQIPQGISIKLHHDDTITMGKTTISFKNVKM